EKIHAYACGVTYGTNSEFGFDYLRDNMAASLEDKVQNGGRRDADGRPVTAYSFAIVDVVDNILIDEARTPLVISGAHDGSREDTGGPRSAHAQGVRRGLRLRVRREVQDRRGDRTRRRQGRALPRHRSPLPRGERDAGQSPAAGAEGGVAVQARRRLSGRRG